MRTTLTLDDDLPARLEEQARRERRTLRDVVNDALRRALDAPRPDRAPPLHDAGLLPGIDPDRLNQLADELEDEAARRE